METQAPISNVAIPQTTPTTTAPENEAGPSPALQEKEVISPVELLKKEREAKEKDPNIDSRFAALVRQQKRLLDEKNKFKGEYEQQKSEIEQAKQFKQAKELVKTDPRKAMEILGISYEELTNLMLVDPPQPKDPEVMTLKEKLEKLEKENQEAKLSAQKAQEEKMLNEFKGKIKQSVASNEKYEFINIVGDEAIDQILSVCEEYYNETFNDETGTGQHLDIDKAADYVENYLEKQFSKLKTSKKLGFASSLDSDSQKTQSQQKQISPTLTNQTDGQSSLVETLNPDERLRKIALKYSQK